MKRTINLLLGAMLCLCTACGGGAKEGTEKKSLGCEEHKATAVFLIDKKRGVELKDGTPLKALKVQADVAADGTFKILSFCKEQDKYVTEYIRKEVKAYTIRRELMEEGYIKPGQQYLILRYQPDKLKWRH